LNLRSQEGELVMVGNFGSVGSVLTEQPPSDSPWTARAAVAPPRPSGPASVRPAVDAGTERAWYDGLLGGQNYEVVYDDADGYPLLAFADGRWYDVASFTPQPVSLRHALRRDAAWSGAVVQTVCQWMRGHPHHERSFELATELALAVGELARHADHGGS
jgi:hypothetical protein